MAITFLPQARAVLGDQTLNFAPLNAGLDSVIQGNRQNALMAENRRQFDTEMKYKNALLRSQAEKSQQLPWWVQGDGQIHPAMRAYREAGRPDMRPMIIGNAAVDPQTGREVYRAPPNPADEFAAEIMRRYRTPDSDGNDPNLRPQSAPFQGGVTIGQSGVQPVSDVMPTAGGQGQGSILDMPPEDLAVLKGSPQTRGLAQGIQEAQQARDAGRTLTSSTAGQVQQKVVALTDRLSDLTRIQNTFKPEYQTYFGKARFEFLKQKDKTVGLTETERGQLSDYAEFRQNAVQQVNNYIREMTGAAMSEAEAKRLMLGVANAGQGLFDGDSPTEFKTKLDNAQQGATLALARYNYLASQGKLPKSTAELEQTMSLGRTRNMLIKKGRSYFQEAKSQGLDDAQARAAAQQRIREEFRI